MDELPQRLHSVAREHVGLTVIVLTERRWETPQPPPVHRDVQAAAYAALA